MTFKLGYLTYALEKWPRSRRCRRSVTPGTERLKSAQAVFGRQPLTDSESRRSASSRRSRTGSAFPPPIFFGSIDVCAPKIDRAAMMNETLAKSRMTLELHYADTTVLMTTTPGHHAPPWDPGEAEIRGAFLRLGTSLRSTG